MKTDIIHLREVDSTNRWLRDYKVEGADRLVACRADYQTAGRGCGQNTWESERGKNLLFSVLVRPERVPASEQFILSMAEALAVKAVLDRLTDGIRLKWPNDIYWHDRKLAGTLIETTVKDKHVDRCIFGTGLNVNQQEFRSDAPNPVSLQQILGREVDIDVLFKDILCSLTTHMEKLRKGAWSEIRQQYHESLYRRGKPHQYRFISGKTEELILQHVEPDGRLVFSATSDGRVLNFGFREIEFII